VGKYLVFIAAADSAATYPIERLISITCEADGVLLFHFESSVGKSDGGDTVQVNITADTEKAVMERVLQEINKGLNLHIVVCDDVNSEYLDSRMTGCVLTLDT